MKETSRRAFVKVMGAAALGTSLTAAVTYLKNKALQRESRSLYEILKDGTDREFEIALQRKEEWLLLHFNKSAYIQNHFKHLEYLKFEDDEHFISYIEGPIQFIKTSLDKGYFFDAYVEATRKGLDEKRLQILLKHGCLQHKLTLREVPGKIPIEELLQPETHESRFYNLQEIMMGEWAGRLRGQLIMLKDWSEEETLKRLGYTKAEIKLLAKKRYNEFDKVLSNYPSQKRLKAEMEKYLSP